MVKPPKCPGKASRAPRPTASAWQPIGLVHHPHILRRQPFAQLRQQRLVEFHAPRFGQLDLAAGRAVLVVDDDRALAAPVWLEEREQALGRTRAVADEPQSARELAPRRGKIVERIGDDAQALHLAFFVHALLDPYFGDEQHVLAQ